MTDEQISAIGLGFIFLCGIFIGILSGFAFWG